MMGSIFVITREQISEYKNVICSFNLTKNNVTF
jgi:hypothetical protein